MNRPYLSQNVRSSLEGQLLETTCFVTGFDQRVTFLSLAVANK